MAKPLSDVIRQLQGGTFDAQSGDKLAEMVKQVEETGKVAKLTITLDLKKVSGGAIAVVAKATDKTPELPPDADLFFASVEGNLLRENPHQMKLPLRQVQEPEHPVRGVADPETGEIRMAG